MESQEIRVKRGLALFTEDQLLLVGNRSTDLSRPDVSLLGHIFGSVAEGVKALGITQDELSHYGLVPEPGIGNVWKQCLADWSKQRLIDDVTSPIEVEMLFEAALQYHYKSPGHELSTLRDVIIVAGLMLRKLRKPKENV